MFLSMSRTALPLLLLVATLPIGCGDGTLSVGSTQFSAEQPFHFEVGRAARTEFRLDGINGLVEVVGAADVSSVVVAGGRRVKSESAADAEANLHRVQVEIDSSATAVEVRTQQPRKSGGRIYEVDYEISVPRDMELELTNINGRVVVGSIESGVTIRNVNGEIAIESLTGNTSAAVTNGAIAASIALPADGRAELRVINGNIDLRIPTDSSARLTASVQNGSIATADLALTDVVSSARSLTGTLGAGGGEITLSTVNGTIRVTGE